MIKPHGNTQAADWILHDLWPLGVRPDGGEGHVLRHLLPDVFESYYKLMHPIFVDSSIEDTQLTWDSAEKMGLSSFNEDDLVQVPWSDLFAEYGLDYQKPISGNSLHRVSGRSLPRRIVFPGEGRLPTEYLTLLGRILKPYTQSSKLFFWYSLVATNDLKSDCVYEGSFEDLADINNLKIVLASPGYWWPEDRQWCVCTDYDLDFTVIGGSNELVLDIEKSGVFEGFRFSPLDRIDFKAAERNRWPGLRLVE